MEVLLAVSAAVLVPVPVPVDTPAAVAATATPAVSLLGGKRFPPGVAFDIWA